MRFAAQINRNLPKTWHYTFGIGQSETAEFCGVQGLTPAETVEDGLDSSKTPPKLGKLVLVNKYRLALSERGDGVSIIQRAEAALKVLDEIAEKYPGYVQGRIARANLRYALHASRKLGPEAKLAKEFAELPQDKFAQAAPGSRLAQLEAEKEWVVSYRNEISLASARAPDAVNMIRIQMTGVPDDLLKAYQDWAAGKNDATKAKLDMALRRYHAELTSELTGVYSIRAMSEAEAERLIFRKLNQEVLLRQVYDAVEKALYSMPRDADGEHFAKCIEVVRLAANARLPMVADLWLKRAKAVYEAKPLAPGMQNAKNEIETKAAMSKGIQLSTAYMLVL